jgi:hypothetical protein
MHADATNQMQQITHDPAKVAHALRVRSVHKKTVKKRFAPSFIAFIAPRRLPGRSPSEMPKLKSEAGKSKRRRSGA